MTFYNRFSLSLFLSIVTVLSLIGTFAEAQSPEQRYQLGRRLTRFERQWQTADETTRVATTPAMQSAVSSFFSLQLEVATTKLDEAWLIAQGIDKQRQKECTSYAGWFLRTNPLIQDASTTTRQLSLNRVQQQSSAEASIDGLRLLVEIVDADGSVVREDLRILTSLPSTWEWNTGTLEEGDYFVRSSVYVGESKLDVIANRFSVISDVKERLSKVLNRPSGAIEPQSDTTSLTSQFLTKMLSNGATDRLAESDMPFLTLLNDIEFLAREGNTVQTLLTRRPKSSYWLQLGTGKSKQHVRFQSAAPSENRPLVVAYHGAGGSENMFFESYGAGGLVELCMRNGWSLITPRQTLFGSGMELRDLLDELHRHVQFDQSRVFVVGHSMGAAQAISQVSKHPNRVKALAAIGGGGATSKSEDLLKIPFYIAAGEKDFGLPRAKALAASLKAAGGNVEFREVKDVEHMVIVQAVLTEIERFFAQHCVAKIK